MSIVHQYFTICEDETKAKCALCSKIYSRGSGPGKNLGTSNLLEHLKKKHKTEFEESSRNSKSDEKLQVKEYSIINTYIIDS